MITEIENVLNATSLLLVFISVLFGIRYPLANKEITNQKDLAPERRIQRAQELQRLRKFLMTGWLPVPLLIGLITYIHLPLYVQVLSGSQFHIWNFSFLPTAYFLMVSLMIGASLWTLGLTGKLLFIAFKLWDPSN